jgi:hypothetical protein
MKDLHHAVRLEAIPQILLAVVLVVLAVLIAASAAEYVAVAQAHALPSMQALRQIDFQGLDAGGNLTENGSVVYTLTIVLTNPSPRVLTFEQLIYKAWIEDGPMEAGVSGLGRTDDVLANETGTHYFSLAFIGPVGLASQRVAPGANGSETLRFTLTKSSGGAEFEAVRNITAFARERGESLAAIPWNTYTFVSFTIDGVPPPASSSAADYLRDDARVILQEGIDLAP